WIPHSPFGQADIPPVPPWMMEPKNLPQQWGKNIGMAGQYAAGAAAVPFSAIPQGLMAAGIAGAQSGGDPESMLGMGILGGLAPGVTRALTGIRPISWLAQHIFGSEPTTTTALMRGSPEAAAQYEWSGPSSPLPPSRQIEAPLAPTPPPQPQMGGSTGGEALPPAPTPPTPKALAPAPRNVVPGTEFPLTRGATTGGGVTGGITRGPLELGQE